MGVFPTLPEVKAYGNVWNGMTKSHVNYTFLILIRRNFRNFLRVTVIDAI